MYAQALLLLKRNISLYTIVVVVVVGLEMLMSATGIVTLIFAGLTMLYTHRMVQLDEVYGWADPLSTTGNDGSKIPIVGYLLRFLAMFVVMTFLMTAGFMILNVLGVLQKDRFLSEIAYALWGMAIGVPIFSITLAFIGTVLPACAERADTSIKAAISRGRRTFKTTLFDIFIGPVLLSFIAMLVSGWFGWALGNVQGMIGQILFRSFATVMTIIPAMLAAIALSRAYLGAEAR